MSKLIDLIPHINSNLTLATIMLLFIPVIVYSFCVIYRSAHFEDIVRSTYYDNTITHNDVDDVDDNNNIIHTIRDCGHFCK